MTPMTLPPIGGEAQRADKDYWTPKNYDGGVRDRDPAPGLENSKNLVTARLLDGGIDADTRGSLKRVCELALEAQLYTECMRYYPFVLGAQPVRIIDLAAFYAAIANEGARPRPTRSKSIEQGGKRVYRHAPKAPIAPRLGRRRRLLSGQDHAAGRGGARHRARRSASCALRRRARPAPPRTRTMPGSSASPTT